MTPFSKPTLHCSYFHAFGGTKPEVHPGKQIPAAGCTAPTAAPTSRGFQETTSCTRGLRCVI